jgi:uncharacterized membrane protein
MNQRVLGFSGLREICNVHPVFVHFPIALFPVTLLFYALGIFARKPDFLVAARVSLYLAAFSGILTAFTGLKARSTIKFNPELGQMVKTHQSVGLTIFAFATALVIWSFFQEENKPKGDIVFLIVLAFENYLVFQNADIGSRMVYTQGAGVEIKKLSPDTDTGRS